MKISLFFLLATHQVVTVTADSGGLRTLSRRYPDVTAELTDVTEELTDDFVGELIPEDTEEDKKLIVAPDSIPDYLEKNPMPKCFDKGQEAPFNKKKLKPNDVAEDICWELGGKKTDGNCCHKINICHGNGDHWNAINVDRSSLKGHGNRNHNVLEKNKNKDYFPGVGIANPNGAGRGTLVRDGQKCKFVKDPVYTTGDPHIHTFADTSYDFHGGCDLVMLTNPSFNNGQGLHIHMRTKITRWWSSIESAAVRIGDDTFEVKAGIEDSKYWINGKEGHFLTGRNFPFTVGGFHGRFRHKSDKVVQYKIFLDNEQSIIIRSTGSMLRIELDHTEEKDFGASLGLMGTYGEGRLVGRDNTTVFVVEDSDAFGQEWQVRGTDPMLFHEAEGPQYPEKCAMPKVTLDGSVFDDSADGGAHVSRRLGGGTVSRKAAEKACRKVGKEDRKNCIFDVIAMDDLTAADGY